MQPEIFYQHHSKEAIPLELMTTDDWLNQSRTQDFSSFFQVQQFKGKLGETCLIFDAEGKLNKVYVGAGEGLTNEVLALAEAATKLPPGVYQPIQSLSKLALLYWSLAQYRFDFFKKQECQARILLVAEEVMPALINEAASIFLVRDLINFPANVMTPQALSAQTLKLAKLWGATFEEWVGEELLKANFPAVYLVGAASSNAPRLLRLQWGDKTHPRVVLVGKGVCFDSGGLNIKPTEGMRLMKKDMGGAAQVLGLAQIIMAQKLPIFLEVLIPTVDNVIGPAAFKPGDIISMRNGLTVEVDNTDAEGRLVLADALAFATETKADLIVDFATLTGAARAAVGTEIAAMFTNDETLASVLCEASSETQDPLWRMPLFSSYNSLIVSKVADLTNCYSAPYAGAITAALFLQRFIQSNTPWVHFDIMAWNLSSKAGKPEGGEAMGIRALAHYLQKKYAGNYL